MVEPSAHATPGPMGVGAVFISTLALTKLPTPASPPQTQQDILSLSLQPIVSFVVLCSIITREYVQIISEMDRDSARRWIVHPVVYAQSHGFDQADLELHDRA